MPKIHPKAGKKKATARAAVSAASHSRTRSRPKVGRKVVANNKGKATSRTRTELASGIQSSSEAPADTHKPPLFFWKETENEGGFLSPWFRAPFVIYESGFSAAPTRYESAGHAIMAEKARLFGDMKTLKRIQAAKTAEEHKTLGNKVKVVDEKTWEEKALEIATKVNTSKFFWGVGDGQHELRNQLLELGDRELVLASPYDRLFGIGFGADEAERAGRERWGKNFFGKSLQPVKRRVAACAQERRIDSSVFDVGGRLSIYW